MFEETCGRLPVLLQASRSVQRVAGCVFLYSSSLRKATGTAQRGCKPCCIPNRCLSAWTRFCRPYPWVFHLRRTGVHQSLPESFSAVPENPKPGWICPAALRNTTEERPGQPAPPAALPAVAATAGRVRAGAARSLSRPRPLPEGGGAARASTRAWRLRPRARDTPPPFFPSHTRPVPRWRAGEEVR